MAAILELEGVSAHYGRIQALRDVSLRVGEGEIVTIIGANGAGKSTTLMTICGIVRASAGDVRYLGTSILDKRADELPAAPMPAGDEILAVAVAAFRRIGQDGRGVAVHHHLAGDQPGAARLGLREQGVDRLRVNRAVDHRGRRAVAQQLVHEEGGIGGGVGRVGEFLLLDEGVFFQPVQQLRPVGGDDLGLREMDVGVDEARQHQPAAMVVDRDAVRHLAAQRGPVPHRGDAAIDPDQQQPVLVMAQGIEVARPHGRAVEAEQASADGGGYGGGRWRGGGLVGHGDPVR